MRNNKDQKVVENKAEKEKPKPVEKSIKQLEQIDLYEVYRNKTKTKN